MENKVYMKKLEIKPKNIYKIVLYVLAKRGILLVVFFGAFLVYSFDVIYKNAYINIEYIDYSNSTVLFDARKESVAMSKITDSLEQKNRIMREGLNRKYKNIFVFEDTQEEIYDKTPETGINTESPVFNGSQILSGDASEVNNNENADVTAGSDAIPKENVQ